MSERIRVDLVDHVGDVVAITTRFSSISVNMKIGEKGSLTIGMNRGERAAQLVRDDYVWRVWYKWPEKSIAWTNIFNGIHKTVSNTDAENGRNTLTSYAPDETELLDKSFILYESGTANATKSGAASTVIYAYVRENLGPLATVANGRDVAHACPITFGADLGVGPSWAGSASRKNLLDTVQSIRRFSIENDDQIDFRVTMQDGYTFLFECGDIYQDRTTDGLAADSRGLNGAGNVPVVLSTTLGNLARRTVSKSRYNEVNTVVGLGRGTGANRTVAVAQRGSAASVSPIAQREGIVSATDQGNDATAVRAAAEERLEDGLAKTNYSLKPLNRNQILLRDYGLGDFVTVEDVDGNRENRQITEISINASGGDITKNFEVSDG